MPEDVNVGTPSAGLDVSPSDVGDISGVVLGTTGSLRAPGISSAEVNADVPFVGGDPGFASIPDTTGSASLPFMDVDTPLGSVDVPASSVDVGMPSGSGPGSVNVGMPFVDLAAKALDLPSVKGETSGDLPSADVDLTGPSVNVEGGKTSLTAALASGAATGLGVIGAGFGLIGRSGKPKAEVRVKKILRATEYGLVFFLRRREKIIFVSLSPCF